jgi:hypothetical protein
VPLDFNLYCSVSPEEMRALQRVVSVARELRVGFAPNGAHAELRKSLSDVDTVRPRRTKRLDRPGGTLAPWLHEYLHPPLGRTSAGTPGDVEPMPRLASPRARARSVA